MPKTTTHATKTDNGSSASLWIGYSVIILLALVGLFLSSRSSFYTCQRGAYQLWGNH